MVEEEKLWQGSEALKLPVTSRADTGASSATASFLPQLLHIKVSAGIIIKLEVELITAVPRHP